jgi:hypothetical protein
MNIILSSSCIAGEIALKISTISKLIVGQSSNGNALIDNGQLFAKQGNTSSVCVGDECCPQGFSYDKDLNICVVTPLPTLLANTTATSSGYLEGNMGVASNGPVVSGTVVPVVSVNSGVVGDVAGAVSSSVGFTTLEYSNVENAYTDLEFNNPVLKRAPNTSKVTPFQDVTKLNVSNFRKSS